ncbi:hypothetical protein C9I57_24270 [Trinickia symbiotica]|uniref:Uncharacterized protein n=1 Tax=Trinickia symbiotica TaxID=863227 RepID=A0A2T3XP53_9BURK|nr:hypothetical protein C9I57_24270 [Trinickia symbiotica]
MHAGNALLICACQPDAAGRAGWSIPGVPALPRLAMTAQRGPVTHNPFHRCAWADGNAPRRFR